MRGIDSSIGVRRGRSHPTEAPRWRRRAPSSPSSPAGSGSCVRARAERRGVLEVLLAADLLDPWVRPSWVWNGMNESGTNSVKPPVRSCSARTTRMCEASSAATRRAEHHRHRRAQSDAVRRLDDLHPARDRQLVGADPLPHAVVEHLGGGARLEPASASRAAPRGRQAVGVAHVRDLHQAVGVQVQLRRRLRQQPAEIVLERQSGWMPDCMQISVAPNATASCTRRANSSRSCS